MKHRAFYIAEHSRSVRHFGRYEYTAATVNSGSVLSEVVYYAFIIVENTRQILGKPACADVRISRLKRADSRYSAVLRFKVAAPQSVRRKRQRGRRRSCYHQVSTVSPQLFEKRIGQLAVSERFVEKNVRILVALRTLEIYVRARKLFRMKRSMLL